MADTTRDYIVQSRASVQNKHLQGVYEEHWQWVCESKGIREITQARVRDAYVLGFVFKAIMNRLALLTALQILRLN